MAIRYLILKIFLLLLVSPVSAQTIPNLDEIDAGAGDDLLYIVDTSDTTDSAAGTGKKITLDKLQTAIDTTIETDDSTAIQVKPVSSSTCGESTKGAIYYDEDDNHFYGCSNLGWIKLDNYSDIGAADDSPMYIEFVDN